MKNAKLLGIIAIIALIIIAMIACEPPEEYKLEGEISISPSTQCYLGETITATFFGKGSEAGKGNAAVDFFLYKKDGNTARYTNLHSNEFKPTIDSDGIDGHTGTFFWEVESKEDPEQKIRSREFSVFRHAAHNFFGTWKMTGADNGDWKANENAPVTDEILIITPRSFRIDSTYDDEYLQYTIDPSPGVGWRTITSGLPTGYSSAFTLTVTNPSSHGYTELTTFRLYLKGTATPPVINRTKDETDNWAFYNGGNGTPRNYVKQP